MIYHFPNSFLRCLLVFGAITIVSGNINALERRDESLIVTSPVSGDTLVAGAYWNITWNSTLGSGKNVTISLRQGPANLTQMVHVIAETTLNNGSYLWRSRDDLYFQGNYRLDAVSSGCNYSMEFRAPGLIVNSQVFSFINSADGGIQPGKGCAGVGAIDTTSLLSLIGSNITTSKGGGVSTGTLGAAVGGTAAGLVALFVALLFLAKKMGWIISSKDCQSIVAEYTSHHYAQGAVWDHKPVNQMEGGEIHQMP